MDKVWFVIIKLLIVFVVLFKLDFVFKINLRASRNNNENNDSSSIDSYTPPSPSSPRNLFSEQTRTQNTPLLSSIENEDQDFTPIVHICDERTPHDKEEQNFMTDGKCQPATKHSLVFRNENNILPSSQYVNNQNEDYVSLDDNLAQNADIHES